MPTISVVLPTRDRPEFVRHALASLAVQEFTDFEVVVADNPVTSPCEDVVTELGDERFRYLRPDRPLLMHDNWEAGCAATTGDYVGVMIDKTLWLPSTMSRALSILEQTSASVLSWWSSGFDPFDERSSLTSGAYFGPEYPLHGPEEFSGTTELVQATQFRVRRGQEGPSYFRGKICFGLYRRDVLDLMRSRIGRLFPPIAPDYTSRAGAFLTASSFVDAGMPLQIHFMTQISNGSLYALDASWARRFLEDIDPGLIDRLPIPGLFASHHNAVAHDYLLAEEWGAAELDRLSLAERAWEDLEFVDRWPDSRTRREQYRLVAKAERRAGRSRTRALARRLAARWGPWVARVRAAPHKANQDLYRALLRRPRLHAALRRAAGKRPDVRAPETAAPRETPPVADTLAGAVSAAETELPKPRSGTRA
jgi:hypothetical protein